MMRAIRILCLLGVITVLCPTHRALMAASPCAQVGLPVVIDVVPVPPSVDAWISDYYDSPLLELPQLAVGSDVTFSASFRGSPPLTFQWRRNGSPLAGQTNEFLRLVNLEKGDSGNYTVRARNEYGMSTSAPLPIEVVIEPPYFGLVPGTREATVGVTSAMRSLAGGSPDILYQCVLREWICRAKPIPRFF